MRNKILSFLFALTFLTITNSAFAATVFVDASATGAGNGTTAVDAFTTIQAAIDAATTVDGDTISIANGTYNVTNTIEVSKSITLQGASEAGTIISATGVTSGLYGPFGIHSAKSNIAFSNFTLAGPIGSGSKRGFKLEGVNPTTRNSGVTISQVTVHDCGSTGIDINGVDNVTLTNVTLTHNGANGFSLTDGNNLTLTNVTTSLNAWGGIAIYTKGVAFPGGVNGVTVTGLNSSEVNPFYVQTEGVNPADSGKPYPAAAISVPQLNYKGVSTSLSGYVFYNDDIAELYTTMGSNNAATTITNTTTGNTVLAPGQTIQARIDAATAGDTIVVPAGNYTENLTITKAIKLLGANDTINPITGTRGTETVLTGNILVTTSNVTISGFKITNPTYSGVSIKGIQLYSSGPTISNIKLSNNIITSVNNANTKGAYGIMVQADVNGVTIESNKIDSITSAGWARGIEVTAGCNVTNVPASISITNNQITNISVTSGTDVYGLSIDWCDSPVKIANASQVTLTGNIFDSTKIKNLDTVHPLSIAKNWFGNTYPDFTSATGSIISYPWCTDVSCSALYAPTAASDWASQSSGGSKTSTSTATTTSIVTGTTTASTTTIVQDQNASSTGQVLGVTAFNFLKDLFFGSRGTDVTELQQILLDQKYLVLKTGKPTGYFGPMTKAALIKWQTANNIPATGYFGKISRDLLSK